MPGTKGRGAITDVSAPDMVWRIEGHSLASREYGSKQQLIAAPSSSRRQRGNFTR
jgi:hypothetical protein